MTKYNMENEVLLTIQNALLGEITPSIRVIQVIIENKNVKFICFFDGNISEDEKESMSVVETELIAGLPEDYHITHEIIRLDYPKKIPNRGSWVYARAKEKQIDT